MKKTTVGLCGAMALCMAAGMAQAGPKPEAVGGMAGTKIEPVRMAKVRMVDGQVKQIGDWVSYKGAGTDQVLEKAFDCYESDDTGFPVGGLQCGLGGDTSRYYFGPDYYSPIYTNDMTVAAGFEGTLSPRLDMAWWWALDDFCVIAVFTAEDFGNCEQPYDADGFYDGVVYDFGFVLKGNGYYYTNIDLTGYDLFHQLPMDGSGAYTVIYGQFFDGQTIFLTPGPAQTMLWGTGDAETPPEPRAGTQNLNQYDDDNPPDAFIDPFEECYPYDFATCLTPLGGMMQFWAEKGGVVECYPDCDGNETLNLFDFLCFVQSFNAGGAYADCDGNNTLNLFDFLCFVQSFNAGC